MQLLKILLFLFPAILYSQESNFQSSVILKKNIDEIEITKNFYYHIDSSKSIKNADFSSKKNWQSFDYNVFTSKYKNRSSNFFLWLQTKIENTTNDTLDLVININSFRNSKIKIISKSETQNFNVGYLVPQNENKNVLDDSSFKCRLLPFEKKIVIINSYVDYLFEDHLKIILQSQSKYNEAQIDRIKKYNSWFLLFGILTGGIFIMVVYNLQLFLQYKEKNYLYYMFHLLFTFLNYCWITDGLHHNFFGNLNRYRDLVLECTYTLSFAFYSIFIYSVLSKGAQKNSKNLFKGFVGFMILYFLSVNIVFITNNYDLISNFAYVAFVFRIVSCFFSFYIIFILLKTHKNSYLKYILYGTLVLVFSYFAHVIFNLFFGNRILNHYLNLFGTLIEILFFTYALNLRKKNAEQERDVLIKMNELKSRFFANISHEFRTPLTLIKSPVQSLKSKITTDTSLHELNLIDTNTDRMLELVNQLLELSKIDSGNLKLIVKNGNISSFLNLLMESFKFQAKEKGINFNVNIQKTLFNNAFDKDVIEKIVANLVSNAFKYTPQNEKINFVTSVENHNLNIIVSNSGNKLKKEELHKLFERFYQKNENNQGVGIGLALVKELVNLYQGTITAMIENDELIFTVNLPLIEANENAIIIPTITATTIIENATSDKNEIPILLIVDDNAEIRMVLKEIFRENYQILEAQDGKTAFKIAKTEIPDCIISDVMMPIMDGFEFTKQIKNNELTSFIPVLLLSAKTTNEVHLEALKCTADAFLTKPFNNEILNQTVNQLIEERKKLHKRYSQELVLRPVDIVINSIDEKFIEKLQIVIDNQLSNSEFTSENFAASLCMSRMQLHRKLKSLLGVTATEFLRNERLKTAIILLDQGNGNISEIAYSVGFNDVSYFSKCFKEFYLKTPTDYINLKKTL